MPCFDAQDFADNAAAKDQINNLTRMLCWACVQLEQTHRMPDSTSDLGIWWAQHKNNPGHQQHHWR